jgi:SAM-dependent methyltransferase
MSAQIGGEVGAGVRRSHPSGVVRGIVRAELRRCARLYAAGKLLDIGCGDKSKESIFQSHVSTYVGLDHAESLHGLAQVDIVASAYDIPEPNDSYDTVISTAVLEHLEEPLQALKEAHRVLRSGGVAIYTAPMFWHLHEEPRDFYRYTKYGLCHLFVKAGFELIELKPLSGFWTTFVTELGYYLQRFRRGPFKYLVDGFVIASSMLLPRLDRGLLKDERFTWMLLIVSKKRGKHEP